MRAGGCARGAVRYRVEGPLRPVIGCQCGTCRRTSGHFVAATPAPRAAVAVTGELRWWKASAEARRGFCPVCGSSPLRDGAGGSVPIHAGTPEDAAGPEWAGHVFCAEKETCPDLSGGSSRTAGRDPKPAGVVGAP